MLREAVQNADTNIPVMAQMGDIISTRIMALEKPGRPVHSMLRKTFDSMMARWITYQAENTACCRTPWRARREGSTESALELFTEKVPHHVQARR